jgi:uncharacterized protein
MIFRLVVLVLVATPLSLAAQEGPSFDCAAAESSAEKLVCADPDLAELDRRLAERFADAVAVAQSLGAGADEAEKTLRAYQRGWVSGRDECWKETEQAACVEREYLFREGQLVAEFLLEEPASVVEYACGDSGAETLTVYTFDTELPSMRVERGDTVDVGAEAGPEMPGSFYLRELGTFTPTDGGAELTDSYGETATCEMIG